jgi:hypothetical protein
MEKRSVTLRDTHDVQGIRHLAASLSVDGTLTIKGQDIGRGVEGVFGAGYSEYEWAWTIKPSEVERLLVVLDSGDDALAGLSGRFSGEAAAGLQAFLDEHGVVYEFWSRMGD